jgi:hypothetical protein
MVSRIHVVNWKEEILDGIRKCFTGSFLHLFLRVLPWLRCECPLVSSRVMYVWGSLGPFYWEVFTQDWGQGIRSPPCGPYTWNKDQYMNVAPPHRDMYSAVCPDTPTYCRNRLHSNTIWLYNCQSAPIYTLHRLEDFCPQWNLQSLFILPASEWSTEDLFSFTTHWGNSCRCYSVICLSSLLFITWISSSDYRCQRDSAQGLM